MKQRFNVLQTLQTKEAAYPRVQAWGASYLLLVSYFLQLAVREPSFKGMRCDSKLTWKPRESPKMSKSHKTNNAAELGMGMLFHGAGRFNHA